MFPIRWRRWPTGAKSSRLTDRNTNKNREPAAWNQAEGLCLQREEDAYPLNTPKTRLRTKKEPKITRLTKYTHGSSRPIASFIWRNKHHHRGRSGGVREGQKRVKQTVKCRNSQKRRTEKKIVKSSFFFRWRKIEILQEKYQDSILLLLWVVVCIQSFSQSIISER